MIQKYILSDLIVELTFG